MKEETEEVAAKWVHISELTPWGDNPRRNDQAVEQVANSIKRFGFASPIIARTNGEVIAGHTRLKAAHTLGIDRVPVRYMDLDPADAKLLALADNKLGELADWDSDTLKKVLQDLRSDGEDLDGLGWDGDELAFFLDDEPIPFEEPSHAIEAPENPVSKTGEIYQLGDHFLICGDCRDPQVVSKLMAGNKINVAITSPPYASQRKYDPASGFKPVRPDDYVAWFKEVSDRVAEHLADDGSWFLNIKEHSEDGQRHLYVKDLTCTHVREWNWRFVEEYVWTHPGTPRGVFNRFKNGWEPIFHFTRSSDFKFFPKNVRHRCDTFKIGRTTTDDVIGNPLLRRKALKQGDAGYGQQITANVEQEMWAMPNNVLDIGRNTSSMGHSAAFPVTLPDFFIRAYSEDGDVVYDPFAGSGTTTIAAEQNNRISYSVEISPMYCDIIRQRWGLYASENDIDPGDGAL